MLPQHGVSTAPRIQTKFGKADNLPYLITHVKFEINLYKIVSLTKGWSVFVLTLLFGGRRQYG